MRVILVVVVDPSRELLQDGRSIRAGLDASIVAFQGLHECLADAVALRAADGGEAGHERKSGGEVQCFAGGVGRAVVASHCTGLGARRVANRRSTQASMRSRTISPLMPPVLACQAMISRSQVSMANATRTTSPFQQLISSTSEDQR